ncbi:elongator complex 5 [Pelobates cultripes]|uniref:Elongator complex protein 5 n=1 Tax=Pelobates cultripes TaxID=61616 RepID=A0AAD1RJ58_PELCU|nr:elongator complex 5 [Pelobates cultripes]
MTDTALYSGRPLLNSFLVADLQRSECVHVVGFEVSQEEFFVSFTEEVKSRVTFHDGFSDPLHWNSESGCFGRDDFTADDILDRIGHSNVPVTIVLDSLSWILSRCSLTTVCHTLLHLSKSRITPGSCDIRLLALLHIDLHSPGVVSSVCSLADTVIHVTERGERFRTTVRHRKKTGKIVITGLEFSINDSFGVEILTGRETKPQRTSEEVDPTMNLTFNLHLSDAERQLKESAALPYVFSAKKKISLLDASSSSAKIFYDLEPGDNMDEEDPDDDLDV